VLIPYLNGTWRTAWIKKTLKCKSTEIVKYYRCVYVNFNCWTIKPQHLIYISFVPARLVPEWLVFKITYRFTLRTFTVFYFLFIYVKTVWNLRLYRKVCTYNIRSSNSHKAFRKQFKSRRRFWNHILFFAVPFWHYHLRRKKNCYIKACHIAVFENN